MKQHDVLNLLGVVQRVGYATALVSAAIVVAGFLLTLVTTQVSTVAFSVPLVVLVAAGLVLAGSVQPRGHWSAACISKPHARMPHDRPRRPPATQP